MLQVRLGLMVTCAVCNNPCSESTKPKPVCDQCNGPVEAQLRIARRRIGATYRKRQQRIRERARLRFQEGKTVLHHSGRLEDWHQALPKSKEIDPATIPPPPQPRLHNGSLPRASSKRKDRTDVRYCTRCEERPLNLGRYKTAGDICGTCKKELREEERQKAREEKPLFAKDQADLQRQLNDETPLPDEDDEEAWAKLLASG